MKYFIIVDMQNDFVTGALKNDAAKAIIPGIVEKAKELKAQGYKIIATRDTHNEKYLETQEGKNLPVPHCIENTPGWEVVDEIKPLVDMYVNKRSFGFNSWSSAIGGFNELWVDYPKGDFMSPEDIQMCGTCTAICVASNYAALKADFPEVPITVYENLCACLTPESHKAAIEVMKTQQAIIK